MKIFSVIIFAHLLGFSAFAQSPAYKNSWTKAPLKTPADVAIDAPLMGNGDLTMSMGYKGNSLSFYLAKNDFWRLRSKADGLSGPRVAAVLDVQIEGLKGADFNSEQLLSNGITTTFLEKGNQQLAIKSWVSATNNLIFIELKAVQKALKISIGLHAPNHSMARLKTGKSGKTDWLERAFVDSVDIPTAVAVALKVLNTSNPTLLLRPGKPVTIAMAIQSNSKQNDPLKSALNQIKQINGTSVAKFEKQHNNWWKAYWDKSSLTVQDSVLMKAYYQGLYTMAACSRDPKFPPGIFGWTTTDSPNWNGDYHLNYNFQAPFYGLVSANRLQQAEPHDAPLLDFISRGEWYAKNVTHTRGILYPVGIGPLGIEVTKDFEQYRNSQNFEQGGLFLGQRSNAAYGLLNMAQYWRCTYEEEYGKKIYPYALAVVNFWEDYLKFENGRYVIYGDAIHEGSGKDKNPILSIGLIRNAFDLIMDLSSSLKRDARRQEKWKHILDHLSGFSTQTRNGQQVFRYTEEGVDWWPDNGLGIQHIYPASAITLDSKEELLSVSRNTISAMQRWHDSNTSNSFFMAAIRIGYDPEVINNELHKYALRTYPNGFQLNNPHGIENSCTVQNALTEMLCMSAGNVIRLFNIPKNENASFKNIRTWGAFLVSARLDDGVISAVKIKSEKGRLCTLINPWQNQEVLLLRNGKKAETLSGNRLSFNTAKQETIELQALVAQKRNPSVYTPDNGNGTFTNPLMWGDWPDPDIIRVDDYFYFVSTSMHYVPGSPVARSRDLVNWEMVGYAVPKYEEDPRYDMKSGNAYLKGSWANTIRYHNGTFYVGFCTPRSSATDPGNFSICTAKDPKGPWTRTIFKEYLYDPGLFFDDDGKVYVVHGQERLFITELNADALSVKTPQKEIYNNHKFPYLEGSHTYKINGKYYLMGSTGGTTGRQICLRADHIYGPYEAKEIINDDHTYPGNGLHQGGMVQLKDGSWWFIIMQDRGPIGRVPNLEPVTWVDGWPMLGDKGKGVETFKKPDVGKTYPITVPATSDEFSATKLGLQWQWNHNPDDQKWSLNERKGYLRLKAGKATKLSEARNTLTQRVQGPQSSGTVEIDVTALKDGNVAGFGIFQFPYAFVAVQQKDGQKSIVMMNADSLVTTVPFKGNKLWVKANVTHIGYTASFAYSTDGKKYQTIGNTLNMALGLDWTANRFALFNYSTGDSGISGYADFNWFRFENK